MPLNLTLRTGRALPRLHPRRLLVAPRLTVEADGTARVEGMVCAFCAARTRSALAAVPGVAAASVSLDDQVAMLRLEPGAGPLDALAPTLQAALERAVVGMRVRRWIARAARSFGARGARGG